LALVLKMRTRCVSTEVPLAAPSTARAQARIDLERSKATRARFRAQQPARRPVSSSPRGKPSLSETASTRRTATSRVDPRIQSPAKKEYTTEFKAQSVRFMFEEMLADESRHAACPRLAPKLNGPHS
jgi:hypothetical protein